MVYIYSAMKKIFIPVLVMLAQAAFSQQHSLEKLWETDTVIAIPESVLHINKKLMYVSLIDGGPWAADGKGGVATITAKGKKYKANWITGLHAPKGMGLKGNELYVADMSDLVVIDTKKHVILKKIPVPGAQALNDVTVSGGGSVYVSDSRTGKVWKIDNGTPVLFMDSLTGVNGLKALDDNLIIAAGKSFISVDPAMQVKKIADLPQGGDGIEPIGNGDYLVTSWSGYIFYVHADGRVETLLNTSADKKNAADIGYDADKKIVYVPTFNAKTIVAYKLR